MNNSIKKEFEKFIKKHNFGMKAEVTDEAMYIYTTQKIHH